MRNLAFWRGLLAELAAGHPVFLAWVVGATEHSPGTRGARMWVSSSGAGSGTIGGGIMEKKLQERAAALLASPPAEFFEVRELHHSREAAGERSGMICAGSQKNLAILLFPERDRDGVAAVVAALESDAPGCVVLGPLGVALELKSAESPSPDPDGDWAPASAGVTVGELFPEETGLLAGKFPDEQGRAEAFLEPSNGLEMIGSARTPQSSPRRRPGPSLQSPSLVLHEYREPLQNPRRIAIFGGGHCGQALARQMALLGYDVLLLETRAAVLPADATTLGEGVAVRVVDDFREAASTVARPEQTVAVVMTTDFPNDVRALEGALRQPFPFCGLMGSPAKIAEIRARLLAVGFTTADLDRLTAPVGLAIGSRTPPEIAVSVAAQILGRQRTRG